MYNFKGDENYFYVLLKFLVDTKITPKLILPYSEILHWNVFFNFFLLQSIDLENAEAGGLAAGTSSELIRRNDDFNVKEIIGEIFNYFDSDIREKLNFIFNYFKDNIDDLTKDINLVFRRTDKTFVVLQYLYQFLEKYIGIYGSGENVNFTDAKLYELLQSISTNPDKINKFALIIREMDVEFIDEIITEFRTWIKERVKAFWEMYKEIQHEISESIQYDCRFCKGVYYSVN